MGNSLSLGHYFPYFTTNTSINNQNPSFVRYGWKPDKLDTKDYFYHLDRKIVQDDLPEAVDLRVNCPKVYDQGKLGSCTANAIAGVYEFDELKQDNSDEFTPSRLFIYYNERAMENNIEQDSGAAIRDGIKSVHKLGVCHEDMWPYVIEKFTERPPDPCYDDAQSHKSIKYERLSQNLHEMKHCLSEGYPFVFGFAVYESFESAHVAKTGYMRLPKSTEKFLGGHAVMAVGYDEEKGLIIVRNSWSNEWGDEGYFYMPYAYILNPKLASDFWTIRRVTD